MTQNTIHTYRYIEDAEPFVDIFEDDDGHVKDPVIAEAMRRGGLHPNQGIWKFLPHRFVSKVIKYRTKWFLFWIRLRDSLQGTSNAAVPV
jgi:hypothetical protein